MGNIKVSESWLFYYVKKIDIKRTVLKIDTVLFNIFKFICIC